MAGYHQSVIAKELMEILKEGKTIYEIMEHIKFPKTTILDEIKRLMNEGMIIKKRKYEKKAGRPKTIFLLKK